MELWSSGNQRVRCGEGEDSSKRAKGRDDLSFKFFLSLATSLALPYLTYGYGWTDSGMGTGKFTFDPITSLSTDVSIVVRSCLVLCFIVLSAVVLIGRIVLPIPGEAHGRVASRSTPHGND